MTDRIPISQRAPVLNFIADNPATDTFSRYAMLVIGGFAVLYMILRPKLRKKDPLESTNSAPKFTLSQQRSVEHQMQNLLVELSEMSRQITAQLDTRSAKLEVLIQDADDRIARLRAASEAAASASPSYPVPSSPPSNHDGQQQSPPSSNGGLPALIATPPPPPPAVDPRHQEVYDLADRGKTPREIADQLHRPSGEIELILALRG